MGWIITTAVGTGEQGYAGDGGPAAAALLNNPFDVAFDAGGNMIFTDTFNHMVRRVDARSGTISTIAGTGERGFAGDGGKATEALLNEPYGIVVDRRGTIYFADRLNGRVRKIDGTGTISTLAGDGGKASHGDGGPAVTAGLVEPNGLAFDAGQTCLFIADVAGHRVRAVDLGSGVISTFAGTGDGRHDGDGGPATAASLFGARAVALAPDGSLYLMERQGSCIRQIRDGIIRTVAGTPVVRGYAGDGGNARDAVFDAPKEMAVDAAGNIFVVDTESHAIRLIDAATWVVTTIAGGRKGPGGDGGPAEAAGLARPHGIAIGPDGAAYIGDSENHRVRKLTRV